MAAARVGVLSALRTARVPPVPRKERPAVSRHAFILVILLPLVWRSGLVLARLATKDERHARFLSLGLALAGWLLAVHIGALLSHDFYVGLFLGTPLAALPGALTLRRKVEGVDPLAPTPRSLWLGTALMVALIAWPQLRYAEHDECEPFGHVGMPQTIALGHYPPRFPYFPAYEMKYHYGVDLLVASVSSVLGHADIAATLHGLTLALFGYAFALLWLLGEGLIGGALGGALAGVLGLLAGGIQLFCRGPNPLSLWLMGDCGPIGTWITPPFLSNFLQHTWTLGTPLALSALLIFSRRRTASLAWYGALWLLFTALSISQVVCFGALLGATCAAGCFEGRRLSPRLALRFMGLGAAVSLAALQLHAFFAPSPELRVEHLAVHPLWTWNPWRHWVAWDLQAFGFLLPLGLAGAFVLKREALVLLLLGVGGAVLSNAFSDHNAILKFSTVAQLPLGVLSAATAAWLMRTRRLWPLGLASALACALFSLSWATAVGGDLPGLWFCKALPAPPPPEDLKAIAFLREAAQPGELLYRSQGVKKYTLYGGLPEPELDYASEANGFLPELVAQRRQLLANPPTAVAGFLAQDFRWVILGPEDSRLSAAAEGWVRAGQAEVRAEFPPLRIYYLKR